MLNTTPLELHEYVTTLIASLNNTTSEAMATRTERITKLDNMYRRFDVSPEIGMFPLETLYRQHNGKKIHR